MYASSFSRDKFPFFALAAPYGTKAAAVLHMVRVDAGWPTTLLFKGKERRDRSPPACTLFSSLLLSHCVVLPFTNFC
jgi:hypothetical protein